MYCFSYWPCLITILSHTLFGLFLSLSPIFPPKDRPASQAGPRDDDEENANDGTSLTDVGEDNDDDSPAEDAVVVKVRF